jgi:hypothetical protein
VWVTYWVPLGLLPCTIQVERANEQMGKWCLVSSAEDAWSMTSPAPHPLCCCLEGLQYHGCCALTILAEKEKPLACMSFSAGPRGAAVGEFGQH